MSRMPNKRGKQKKAETPDERSRKRESGLPGGGQGRVDEVGPTGVYPMSAGLPEGRHPEIRTPASWGQGERGAEGYNDAGGSELVWRDGQLLGGLTAGPGGEPTIDIHGGDRPPRRTKTMPRTAMNLIAPAVRDCIDECVRCHEICLSTETYCLEQGGSHAEEAHITLLVDCADICQTAADFMLRGSDEHGRICAVCAVLCQRCAEDCDQFVGDDVMHACAEACRRCADSCEQVSTARV